MTNSSSDRNSRFPASGDFYGNAQLIANILNWFITLILAGLVAGIFIVLSTNNTFAATLIAISLPFIAVSYYFVHRRNHELAALVLALTLISLNTVLSTQGMGIHNISNMAYPVILVVAGLVSQKRTMALLTVFVVGCVGWLVFGELSGAYIPHVLVRSVPGDFFSAAVILVITAIMVSILSRTLMSSYLRLQKEFEERREIEDDLRQRESILEAVTFAAEQFLKTPDWRANIDLVLERLGRTINATHAYLFEHHPGQNSELTSSMRFEWTAPGYPSDLENPEFQSISLVEKGFESYFRKLRNGEPFIGNLSTFLPAEREFFSRAGIKAMVEVPLTVDGKWWGTIGFDDFEVEREWSKAEVDALKIAAGILGGAIKREIADSALQRSERIYRQAIEAADAVPYYQDYKSNSYLFIGEGIRSMTGYDPGEITPQVWFEIVQESIMLGDAAGLTTAEAVEAVRHGKIKAWKCDQLIHTRTGQLRWLTDRSIELLDDQNISHGSIGILQDVTDRKQTEASLRQREAILDAVAVSAELLFKVPEWRTEINDMLMRLGKAINASHAYLFENHAGQDARMFGSMRFQWAALDMLNDLDHPKYQNVPLLEPGLERWYEVLREGQPYVGDRANASPAEIDIFEARDIKAVLDVPIIVDGEWWGVIGFDDVTIERIWSGAEVDALRVAGNVLGAAIQRQLADAALTNELSQRKLLIEELETKNAELESFTYTVSHDLKSPLVTINGFLGYLEQDAVGGNTDRLRKDILRIQEAVGKMQRMLNELLGLSRIGRMMNAPETVLFNNLIEEALDIVHGRLEECRVSVHIQPNLPAIYGDKPRLTEALQNLLDNAAKYMGEQTDPLIAIGQRGFEDGKPVFFIRDNGIGIAPEYHERVFGLFNKLDAKSEGTGVGLALVKRIIEFHGGRIWVESDAEKGATFLFTLPLSGRPRPESVI